MEVKCWCEVLGPLKNTTQSPSLSPAGLALSHHLGVPFLATLS